MNLFDTILIKWRFRKRQLMKDLAKQYYDWLRANPGCILALSRQVAVCYPVFQLLKDKQSATCACGDCWSGGGGDDPVDILISGGEGEGATRASLHWPASLQHKQ